MKDKFLILLILLISISIFGFLHSLIKVFKESGEIKVKLVKQEELPKKQVKEVIKEEPEEIIMEEKEEVLPMVIKRPTKVFKEKKEERVIRLEPKEKLEPKEEEEEKMKEKKIEYELRLKQLQADIEDYRVQRDMLAHRLAQLEKETLDLQKEIADLQNRSTTMDLEKDKFLLELERLKDLGKIAEAEKLALRTKLEETSAELKNTSAELKNTSAELKNIVNEYKKSALSAINQARERINQLETMPFYIIGIDSIEPIKEELKQAELAFEEKKYLKSMTLATNVKEKVDFFIYRINDKISTYNKSLMERLLTLFIF
jgi:DNA repair exonuclease SbcCD ATPase subunit